MIVGCRELLGHLRGISHEMTPKMQAAGKVSPIFFAIPEIGECDGYTEFIDSWDILIVLSP